MQVFIAVLAIAALAYADPAKDVAQVKKYIDCAVKAMIEGVPSVPVPKHNPVYMSNFSLKEDFGLIHYDAGLTDNILYNLMDFKIPVLNASRVDTNRVKYTYEITWEKLNITGSIKYLYKAFPIDIDETAPYSVILENVRWSGTFDFTNKIGDAHAKVNDFTLHSRTKAVHTHIDNLFAFPVEAVVSTSFYEFFNNFPYLVAEFFRTQRFNDFWLGHPERVNAVMDLCKLPHY